MARYTDRLIWANFLKAEFTGNFQTEYTVPHIHALIDSQYTVDAVEVVHSEWIPVDDGDPGDEVCKRCGCYHHVWEAYGYYCQHCGAKMDGGRDDG